MNCLSCMHGQMIGTLHYYVSNYTNSSSDRHFYFVVISLSTVYLCIIAIGFQYLNRFYIMMDFGF